MLESTSTLKDFMTGYLQRKDVREKLNILKGIPDFADCNNQMYSTYRAFREASIWIYNIILGYTDRYRVMHYSGDTDGAVATLGTRRWIWQQNWQLT